MANFHDLSAVALDGQVVGFSAYRDNVVLVVNTASKCRFTPQYQGLQKLHEAYRDRGLRVLAFPCNQFGEQEPGSAADIAGFCRTHYDTSFQLFAKIEVNGAAAHPLYKWLTAAAPGFLGTRAIKWNFTKFLVGRDGRVVRRYGSWTSPQNLAGDIDRLLAQQHGN